MTADWGAVIENSIAYQEISEYLRETMRDELQNTFEREFKLIHSRIEQQIQKRLDKLPEHRRPYAQAQLQKVLKRFYGEQEEKIQAVVALMLDALERDEYWEVLRAIHNAEQKNVQQLV